MTDIEFENHGSIFVMFGRSPAGVEWIDENVQITDETQCWGTAIVVEPRYVADIAEGAIAAGLTVA